jgi:hypothetical protein
MNFSRFSILMIMAIMLSLLNGCDHSNSRRMTAPEEYQSVELKNEVAVLKNTNAIDILFVVDNSKSMTIHQRNLANNIQHFVKAFDANKEVDYHIGVTSVFDSTRYGSVVQNFNPNGFLLPLKGNTGDNSKYFYTKRHNDLTLLANSIHIGVLNLEQGGPEKEEALSPIDQAFKEPALSSPTNQGFLRPDARLAIIIITDADDSSPNLAETDLDYTLKRFKDDPMGDKISTFAVLANRDYCKDDKDCLNRCAKVDPDLKGEKPYRILNFITASDGKELSLCKGDFAATLSQIGAAIEKKVQRQFFPLQGVPEHGTLKVYLGDKELPPGAKTWTYDPTRNTVIVTAIPSGTSQEELKIRINYTRVNMQNQKNGRAKRVGQL